jgi:hypothetical protein
MRVSLITTFSYLVKKIPDGLLEKIQLFKESDIEAVDPTTLQVITAHSPYSLRES